VFFNRTSDVSAPGREPVPAAQPPVAAPAAPRPVVRSHYRDRDFALRRSLLAADILGIWLALGVAMAIPGGRAALHDSLLIVPILPFWAMLFRTYGLYRRPIRRFEPTHLEDASTLFHALVIGALCMWLYYKLIPFAPKLNFEEIVLFGLLALPTIASLRVALRMFNLRRSGPERVFAVAPLEDVGLLQRKLRHHPEYEMKLVGAVSCEESSSSFGLPLDCDFDEIEALLTSGQVEHLMVRLDAGYLPQEIVRELMHVCHREGVRFSCFPGNKDLLLPGTELNHLEGVGLLTSNPPVLSRTSAAMKRGLDIVVSGVALAILAPFLALIALAIRLDSKGPVLFRQTRVGKDGRRFKLVKFRTMVQDAENQVAELMKLSIDPDWLVLDEDPRVTRLGRFLRRTSIDELPQLWNVLRGEMSIVGPRPLPERDDRNVHGRHRHRLDLVPGITGYWQVLGRNNIPFQEMLEVDYAYITGWSMWHDLRILARTIPVVIRRRGSN